MHFVFSGFCSGADYDAGGPENHTNVIGLNIYNYAFRYSQMGYASAMAVVLLGIILIVSLVQLKVGKQDWEY